MESRVGWLAAGWRLADRSWAWVNPGLPVWGFPSLGMGWCSSDESGMGGRGAGFLWALGWRCWGVLRWRRNLPVRLRRPWMELRTGLGFLEMVC
jgi:hypothetical protein